MKTDEALQHNVMEEIERQPGIDAAHIGVAVRAGVVTLTGHVTSYSQKCAAEDAVKRVRGVLAVANDLEVVAAGHERDDTDIAEAAVHALQWDALVPDDGLTVAVRDGRVRLEGFVEWQYQKDAAEAAVRNLAGVTDLTSSISIRPRAESADVGNEIAVITNARSGSPA